MARIPRWSGSGATARLILSRLDGSLDLSDIAALTGVDEQEIERTLKPLLEAGLVAVKDSSEASTGMSMPPPAPQLVYERRSSGEIAVEGETSDIPEEEKRRLGDLYARLDKIDYYRLLGVAATADTKEIKRAYFALAKLHHPDRWFRKQIGPLRPKIEAVFAAMTRALETLSDPDERAAYDAYLREVLKTRITRRTAGALESRGEWGPAAETWARVAEALPRDAFVLHRWAYALLRSRAGFDLALDAATRAIELDPNRAEYRITAASLHLAMGHERSAVAELEIACGLESDRADIAGLHAALAERVKSRGSGR